MGVAADGAGHLLIVDAGEDEEGRAGKRKPPTLEVVTEGGELLTLIPLQFDRPDMPGYKGVCYSKKHRAVVITHAGIQRTVVVDDKPAMHLAELWLGRERVCCACCVCCVCLCCACVACDLSVCLLCVVDSTFLLSYGLRFLLRA